MNLCFCDAILYIYNSSDKQALNWEMNILWFSNNGSVPMISLNTNGLEQSLAFTLWKSFGRTGLSYLNNKNLSLVWIKPKQQLIVCNTVN